ncbi:hypothetical protein Tco_1460348, partial [Tanacetum coccineum]
RVRTDEDERMSDAEVVGSDKGDEEVFDAAKADAEKTSKVKDDAKKTELPPSSSRLSVSLGFSDQFLKTSSNTYLIGTVMDFTDAEISSLMDVNIQSEVPQIQSPIVLKVPVSVIAEPSVLTPIPETPSATNVTTSTPISISTILQLRVANLEKDVSKLKNLDISAEAFATLETHVPTIIDNYLGTKVGNVFQKELQKQMADLIQKYSLMQAPESSKIKTPTIKLEQESEKSRSEILKIKKEQAEKQQKPQFTIKSTDKEALKEFDLKSALYQHMHANKSFNINPANHRLYHALMKALIKDKNAMDRGVADTVKDHKRKHDGDDDDDDEGPSTGPNQGKQTKRRRTKESESSKKPSSTKEKPKGTTPTKGFKTDKSASAKEPVEEPIAEVVIDNAGDDAVHDEDLPQAASQPRKDKTPEWFKQPPRSPTPDSEWNKRQVVLDQPEQPWFNQMVFASKDPFTFNDLMATPIDFSKYVLNGLKIENLTQDILLGTAFNLLKGTCSSSIELEYNFQECFNMLTDKLDWNNP